MSNYRNAKKVIITIEDFGYCTDYDVKEAVIEALAADLKDPNGTVSYIEDEMVTVEVID